jgi:L-alanine-DL-glutamate epimerase-like enolase superfamily enzyme
VLRAHARHHLQLDDVVRHGDDEDGAFEVPNRVGWGRQAVKKTRAKTW